MNASDLVKLIEEPQPKYKAGTRILFGRERKEYVLVPHGSVLATWNSNRQDFQYQCQLVKNGQPFGRTQFVWQKDIVVA